MARERRRDFAYSDMPLFCAFTKGSACYNEKNIREIRFMARFCAFLIVLALLLPAAAAATEPVRVFVSVLPLKYFVERIGGARVSVEVMVGPGQSPATYDPTPRQMARLSRAELYFRVGVPFENIWMARIVDINRRMRIVDLRDGIHLRPIDHRHHADKNGHGTAALDPHVWTSPPLAKIMAGHIRQVLTDFDPAHGEGYRVRHAALADDLDRLDRELKDRLAGLAHRRFLVFHPSWGYFAEAYGLEQVAIESAGKTPGPRALASIIDLARARHIRVIFVQEQFSRATAATVARAIGARVATVDPLAEDYLANLRKVSDAFLTALER
jgi:zinc transport system substrate-binding protein